MTGFSFSYIKKGWQEYITYFERVVWCEPRIRTMCQATLDDEGVLNHVGGQIQVCLVMVGIPNLCNWRTFQSATHTIVVLINKLVDARLRRSTRLDYPVPSSPFLVEEKIPARSTTRGHRRTTLRQRRARSTCWHPLGTNKPRGNARRRLNNGAHTPIASWALL